MQPTFSFTHPLPLPQKQTNIPTKKKSPTRAGVATLPRGRKPKSLGPVLRQSKQRLNCTGADPTLDQSDPEDGKSPSPSHTGMPMRGGKTIHRNRAEYVQQLHLSHAGERRSLLPVSQIPADHGRQAEGFVCLAREAFSQIIPLHARVKMG